MIYNLIFKISTNLERDQHSLSLDFLWWKKCILYNLNANENSFMNTSILFLHFKLNHNWFDYRVS